MHFTLQGPWVWGALALGIFGVLYYAYVMIKLALYFVFGQRCTGFVERLECINKNGNDEYVLNMSYYRDGERVTGIQEDFVKLEKPYFAEAKYKSGETYDIILNRRRADRFVLRHRLVSSLIGAAGGMLLMAAIAAVAAKLCIFGFSFS